MLGYHSCSRESRTYIIYLDNYMDDAIYLQMEPVVHQTFKTVPHLDIRSSRFVLESPGKHQVGTYVHTYIH